MPAHAELMPKASIQNNKKQFKPAGLLSQGAYAKSRGLSRRIIVRQIAEGLIPTHGSQHRIDPEEADAARLKLDPVHGGQRDGPNSDMGEPDFWESRARKERALASLRELELKVKEGELVPLGKINAWIAGMIIRARDLFLRIGPELRDRLAREADPVSCEQMIDREIRRGLLEMSQLKATPEFPAGAKASA